MSGHAAAQIDEAALGPYLEAHVPGFRGLRSAVKFKDGQSNPTFRLEADSGLYVLRAKPPGELLKSAHQVDREFRVMAALADTNVPVPAMLHLAPDEGSPIGRMFYVMEHKTGRVFWDPALPELTVADRAAVYDQMNMALADLHMVDVKAVGLEEFGRPGDYFARQLSRWTKQYRASETGTNPDMDRLIDWLEKNPRPDDGQVSLVHGDYRLDNTMFHAERPEMIAVLDWELSTLGHPDADLAYQCMNWRLPHAGAFRGLDGTERSAATGLPVEEEYVAAYCARRGIDRIENWPFCIAFSFFRLGAIIQGVYKRAIDGNASNPERARQMGQAVPVLARLAVEELERNA